MSVLIYSVIFPPPPLVIPLFIFYFFKIQGLLSVMLSGPAAKEWEVFSFQKYHFKVGRPQQPVRLSICTKWIIKKQRQVFLVKKKKKFLFELQTLAHQMLRFVFVPCYICSTYWAPYNITITGLLSQFPDVFVWGFFFSLEQSFWSTVYKVIISGLFSKDAVANIFIAALSPKSYIRMEPVCLSKYV